MFSPVLDLKKKTRLAVDKVKPSPRDGFVAVIKIDLNRVLKLCKLI